MKLDNSPQIVKKLVKEVQDKEDAYFEQILRSEAYPPIKGKLTRGKIRWRGIKLIVHTSVDGTTKWLQQRGQMIGSKIHYKIDISQGYNEVK